MIIPVARMERSAVREGLSDRENLSRIALRSIRATHPGYGISA